MKRLLIIFLTILLSSYAYAENMQLAKTCQGVSGAVATVDATAPTSLSCTIPAAGTSVTVVYSEPVDTSGYDDDVDCNIDCDVTTDATMSAPTGTGNTRSYTLSKTINSTATDSNCNMDCTFGANDIIDIYSNDHANVTSLACTNNSTQGGVTCSSGTGSLDWSGATAVDDWSFINTVAEGQSFQVTEDSIYIYSIEVTIVATSSTQTVECRWGNSADLASGYYDSATYANVPSGNAYREFVFADTTHVISSGTTYYFACINLTATENTFVGHIDAGGLTSGQNLYGTAGDPWHLTETRTSDVKFKVNKCAD